MSWAILQPFLAMVIFSLFFGHLAHVPSDGVPYPIFAFTALVPWTFFQYGLTQASNAMVQSNVLLTKIYCPRLIIPIAAVLSGAVDFVLPVLEVSPSSRSLMSCACLPGQDDSSRPGWAG